MRFQRTNYLVSDANRALLFYRDILGMTLDFMKQSEDDSYSYEVFNINKGKPIEFAILSYKDQPRVMALTILGEDNLGKNPLPRRSAICIEVDDVDDVLNKCREHGFHCFKEEHLVTHDGREGREVGILDDDGNLTLIYKIEKKE